MFLEQRCTGSVRKLPSLSYSILVTYRLAATKLFEALLAAIKFCLCLPSGWILSTMLVRSFTLQSSHSKLECKVNENSALSPMNVPWETCEPARSRLLSDRHTSLRLATECPGRRVLSMDHGKDRQSSTSRTGLDMCVRRGSNPIGIIVSSITRFRY